MYQKLIIVGRLGREPELRYTPQGKAVVNLSVAVDGFAAGQKHTTWFRVSAWEKTAENVNQYLKTGALVLCEGEVSTYAYIGKDGKAYANLDMHAHIIKFLPSGNSEGRSDTASAEPPAGVESGGDVLGDEFIPF